MLTFVSVARTILVETKMACSSTVFVLVLLCVPLVPH